MRLVEALFFICLATGVHAAIWHATPATIGARASGGGGADAVSVQAASAAHQAMVTAWQRPPTAITEMASLQQTPQITALATPAIPQPAPVRLPDLTRLNTMAPAPETPEIDTAPADLPTATRPRMRQPQTPAAAHNQPARQAVGTARQAQKGTGGKAQTDAETAERTNALRAAWGSQIHASVHRNMRYPRGASSSGTAKLTLTLAPSGQLQNVTLARSSGDTRLDQAAFDAVKRAGKFAQAPDGLAEPKYAFSLSLTFAR